MMTLGPLGFAAPWLLIAGIALPVLWFLLRAVPPRPREVVFPGTALLAGLTDPAAVTQRTPWWLLVLRLAAVALAILALAGPVWRPGPQVAGTGPLLVVMDAGWAAAPGWADARTRALDAIAQAETAGRPVALWLADGQGGRGETVVFAEGAAAAASLRGAGPQAWATRYPSDPAAFLAGAPDRFETLWLADGLDHPGRAALMAALAARGAVTVQPPSRVLHALAITPGEAPSLTLTATAPGPLPDILALGPDPQEVPRQLARLTPPAATASAGGVTATIPIDLPPELRNRVTRFVVEGASSAGAVALADDRVRRRKVALVGDARATEGQNLLSPLHYLRQALSPSADLIEGSLPEILPAAPDVVVLVDTPPGIETAALADWVAEGGLLIRFAGPRLAGAPDLAADLLLPVRLRPGGRDAGGALSWGDPRGLAPLAADGPFAGLPIPADVTVRAQLLPEPDPDLPARTLAALTDGTPLVTRVADGQGQIVLFHTTANAEWSNLALSGLFVSMLDRLVQTAGRQTATTEAASEAPHWTPETVLDGFGRPFAADALLPGALAPVPAADFAAGPAPGAPAGIYAAGARRAALNAGGPMTPALTAGAWPGATLASSAARPGTAFGGGLLALAALTLMADALGSALVAGSRRRERGV